MKIILEGFLTKCNDSYIYGKGKISESEEFLIIIKPETTTISFPDGLSFDGTVDYQKQFFQWVGLTPAKYHWGTDGTTMVVEIDLPPPDCKFRLEMGNEKCWWAGFETHTTRYLKRFPVSS